jgi:hypothetical protein
VKGLALLSNMIQRGAVQFFRHLGEGPAAAATHRPSQLSCDGDTADFDRFGDEAAVLRILIEEFGGEVESSTFSQRLVRPVKVPRVRHDLWLRGILVRLEHRGAVTLEQVNGTEVIARIAPVGVGLAYDPTYPGRPAQTAGF